MFQEIIQQMTDNHDQIISKFQEKIDSDEFYYSLTAQLISPTDIRFYIETEYDGGQIEGLCLKIMILLNEQSNHANTYNVSSSLLDEDETLLKDLITDLIDKF